MWITFKKKRRVSATQRERDALEKPLLTENLYRQNLELTIKNKIFTLLRQLYQVSLQELEPKKLTNNIVLLVRDALNLELVSIYRFNEDQDTLSPLASAQSDQLKHAIAPSGNSFITNPISHVRSQPYFAPLYEDKALHTDAVEDIWKQLFSVDGSNKTGANTLVRSVLTYPLSANENIIGVLMIGFNRSCEELSEFERDALDSIVTVTSVALDRAHLYQELTEANAQQIALIHFVTHQIKGFLSKSRSIFSMMKEGDFGLLSDVMRHMVEEGFTSDTKGIETIQEILNASNIKNGSVSILKETYDLHALIEGVVHDLRQLAIAKRLTLTFDAHIEHAFIKGDVMQMSNAIKNLVDNAIKYTPAGSVHITLEKNEETYRITIADTGVGITSEDMKHLFTKGGHGQHSIKVNVESTGYGLYITKNIIEAQGGTIRVDSTGEGKGATFIVEFHV